MRTSNKILAVLAAVIVVGLIILMATFRGFAGKVMKDTPGGMRISGSGARIERTYDLEGFSRIESSGGWEITVVHGDSYDVRVTAPENVQDILRIRRQGDSLILGIEPGNRLDNVHLTAEVVMPELAALEGSGGIACTFSGFSGERLDIEISGGAFIKGSDGMYERLYVDVSGAANVDLDRIKTVNADVNLSGAGNIELTMAGGALTGALSGAANLTYHGTVSRLDVDKSGIASINHE